jgi:predicted flap endonuclease-1-like 5' DNA nuclease
VAVVPVPAPAAAPLPAVVVLARKLDAARAAGFSPCGADDLLLLAGIGPRIALHLRAVGLGTFAALAASTLAQLQTLLDVDASPWLHTWPEQAALAADGQWDALRQLQDELHATA